MTETRFPGKTNKYGITTILAVVVMLLLFMASCGKENKEVVEVEFDPENTSDLRLRYHPLPGECERMVDVR